MANWLDVVALIATAAAFGGTIYGVLYALKQISQSMESTKEALKTKGLHISDKGVSVKTSRRFDQEDYVDATQRGFIKAMSASSFGKADPNSSPSTPSSMSPSSPPQSQAGFAANRQRSSSSIKTTSSAEEKKKGIFGIRKGFSGTKEKN